MSTITEGREYISDWVDEMNKGMKSFQSYRNRGLAIDLDVFVEGQKGPVNTIRDKMPGLLCRRLNEISYNPLMDELVLSASFSTLNYDDFYTKIKIPKFSKRVKPERLIGHSWEEEYKFQNVRVSTNSGILERMAGEGNRFFVNIRIFH